MLRIWAKERGGTFPDDLAPMRFAEECHGLDQNLTEAEQATAPAALGRAFIFLARNHPDAQYVGAGVKLGDADTPILWYKRDDAETYRVMYGDLHIGELAGGQLPATPADAR